MYDFFKEHEAKLKTYDLPGGGRIDDLEQMSIATLQRSILMKIYKLKKHILLIPGLRTIAKRVWDRTKHRSTPITTAAFNPEYYLALNHLDFIRCMHQKMLDKDVTAEELLKYSRFFQSAGSTEAIVYLIYTSKEFNSRFEIKNIKRYKKAYNKCRIKLMLIWLPIVGTYIKLRVIDRVLQDTTVRIISEKDIA
jgi:hypothetical protein